MKRLRNESGQALVMAAVGLAAILGFVALATDIGLQLREKALAQTAADAAAMAGASQIIPLSGEDGLTGSISNAAYAAALQNGFPNSAVTVNDFPLQGAFAGHYGYVEAVVTQSTPAFFMKFFGRDAMTVSARAVATLGNSQNCIYALGSSGIVINASNGANLTAANCGIVGNGNLSVVGGAQVDAQSIAVAGTSTINNGGSTSTPPATGIAPEGDPLSYLTPPPYDSGSCQNPPAGANGSWAPSLKLGPGSSGGTVCYNGLNIGNGTQNITFTPGIYVINGNFTLQGGVTFTATGVTFYFPNAGDTININNGVTATLTAPTTGPTAGILFYQNPADTSPINLQGGANSNLQGVIYAPTAPLNVANGTGTQTYVDLVVNSLTIAGGANLNNYDMLPGSADPIKAIRLVE